MGRVSLFSVFMLFIGLVLVGSVAGVGSVASAQEFSWRADGNFVFMAGQSDSGAKIKGSLREGGKVDNLKIGPFVASVRDLGGFIVVCLAQDGLDLGQVFLFEQQNSNYRLLNAQPIGGRAAGLSVDFDDTLKLLKDKNGWDASLGVRAMIAFFDNNPDKLLTDFADQVEKGRVSTMPRPKTKVPMAAEPIQPSHGQGDDDVSSRPPPRRRPQQVPPRPNYQPQIVQPRPNPAPQSQPEPADQNPPDPYDSSLPYNGEDNRPIDMGPSRRDDGFYKPRRYYRRSQEIPLPPEDSAPVQDWVRRQQWERQQQFGRQQQRRRGDQGTPPGWPYDLGQ